MGYSPYEAVMAVQGSYGSPSSYQAGQEQKAGNAAAIGQLAGMGAGMLPSYLGSSAGAAGAGAGAGTAGAAGAAEVVMPSQLGGSAALEGGGLLGSETLAAAGPYALAAIGAYLASKNFSKQMHKYKTSSRGEALKGAVTDWRNWLSPIGIAGAVFGDRDMYLTERRRLEDLQKKGINVPDQLYANTDLAKGRSKQELIDQAKEDQAAGRYANVKFAESRSEKDLKPEDIWGYSTFFEKYGNDWLGKFSEEKRRQIAQQALDAGAVREHHGTIDIDWGKVKGPKEESTAPKQPETVKQGLLRNIKGK